ncbi:MAG: glycosyltransferase family 4 protein [Anaerolineaceae bacterium]|nr:glycosyltransferase family 4 protein [Anaerolineaceae bacterium]
MKLGIAAIHKNYIGVSRHELISALQDLGYTVSYLGQGSDKEDHPDFKNLDVCFVDLPIERVNVNPVFELKTLFEIRKKLKSINLDSLIIYGIRTFPIMALAGKLAGVENIICIVNGTGRLFFLDGVYGFLVRLVSLPMLWLAFLMADFVFFQNPDDLALIKGKHLLWKQNYGRINGSGVNLEKFHLVPLETNPIFTMICRVTGAKGVNEYIQAALTVKVLYPEAVFQLIGRMDDRDQSINQQTFHKAVQKGIVQYIGRVDDVRPYITKTRFYVLPSYYEGTPRSVLEAMAMGRPIITTDAPGCRETVVDGVNGFLVPIRDADALADKMIWLIEHPDEAARMGGESRRIAEEKFDIYKINEKIIQKLLS